MEKPPDTSVPKPTCDHICQFRCVSGHDILYPYLDPTVEQHPDLRDAAPQVEVTRRTMADASSTLANELDLALLEVHRMCEHGVLSQQPIRVVHARIGRVSAGTAVLPWREHVWREELLHELDLARVLGYVCLDRQVRVRAGELSEVGEELGRAADGEAWREDRLDECACGVWCEAPDVGDDGVGGFERGFGRRLDVVVRCVSVHIAFLFGNM